MANISSTGIGDLHFSHFTVLTSVQKFIDSLYNIKSLLSEWLVCHFPPQRNGAGCSLLSGLESRLVVSSIMKF